MAKLGKNDNKETILIFIGAIIALLVILYILSPDIFVTGTAQDIDATPVSITITGQTSKLNTKDCLARYGVSEDTVIMFESNICTYSQSMHPWILELQNKGYKFFFANIENVSSVGVVTSCLSDVADLKFTPEFICPRTNRTYVGSFSSIETMEIFALGCNR